MHAASARLNILSWRLGGESSGDPNREIESGFVFVSCVRAKLCARIPLWLGVAKLFSAAAAPVGGRTSRDVPSIKTIKANLFITKNNVIFSLSFSSEQFRGPLHFVL